MTLRSLALTAVLMPLAFGVVASPAMAGSAPGLCKLTTARGTIPSSFAVDACFDGSALALRNNLTVALSVVVTGDTGHVSRTESDYGLAADATRLQSHDSDILLPGDELHISIGGGAARFRVQESSSAGFYALATTVATFIPGKPNAVIGAFTALIKELSDDFSQYANCLAGKNWISQLGCRALLGRNVGFAVGRATIVGSAKELLGALLSLETFTAWARVQPGQVKSILQSGPIILSQSAKTTPVQNTTQANPRRAQTFAIGSSFDDECVVAWPTAPVRTTHSIQMTMSCSHVPESSYLLTEVIYDDPNLAMTPSTGKVLVRGRVVDVAQSGYGYKELVVQAQSINIP